MRFWRLALLGLLSAVTVHSASADGLVSAILPTGRSGLTNPSSNDNNVVTVFATVINTSGKNLDQCKLDQSRYVADLGTVGYGYTLTDPVTNLPTGNAGSPFSLSAGASQTMVISIGSIFAAGPLTIHPSFVCTDPLTGMEYDALSVDGLNTIQYSASAQQPPDVVALSGTLSGDGVVHIVGNGAAPFVVAVTNVGSTDTIAATVDTGGVQLPLQASICQTNTATGQCLQPPATSTSLSLAANATASFSIFVFANGELPFRPDADRVFVRFTDSTGAQRGGTSVAVTNAPTLDRSQPVGGIYSTQTPYFDDTKGIYGVSNGILLVGENGAFQGLNDLGNQTAGTLTVQSDLSVGGTGTEYYVVAPLGGYPTAGVINSMVLSGAISQKNTLYVQSRPAVQSSNDYPYSHDSQQLSANYEVSAYERGSSMAAVAGNWNVRDGSGNLLGTVTIDQNGSYSGTTSGCAVEGVIGLIDTRYDVYSMNFTLPSCILGPYNASKLTGLAALVDDQTTNDTLLFIGSDASGIYGSFESLTRY